MLIRINHDADIDKARAILLELAGRHPLARQVCGCPVTQWDNAGIMLSLDAWCADSLDAIVFRCDLLEQAAKRFALAGIIIPTVPDWNRIVGGPPALAPFRVTPHGEIAAAAAM